MVVIPLLSVVSRHPPEEATAIATPGELLGVLYLDSRCPTAFSGLDLQILDALAREASSVLDNARLIQKERQRQRLERELDIARAIQQALLPKTLQRFRHLEVVGTNQPCLAVGGDYFDLIELDPDRAALIIADVSGKGLGAALVTAMLQGTFSSIAMGQNPSRVFTHVNRFICSHAEVGRYATVFFATIDAIGNLEYVNTGHLPPIRIRGDKVEQVLEEGSVPLGLLPQTEYKAYSAKLERGDTLVLYTDGITEALNPRGEMFLIDRLLQVVLQHAGAPVGAIQSAILTAVDTFVQGADQADDTTIVVAQYLGVPGLNDAECPSVER